MKITTEHWLISKIKVVDVMGKGIDNISSFDVNTKEAEIFLPSSKGEFVVVSKKDGTNSICLAKVVLPGAKVVWRDTGEELTNEQLKVHKIK